MCRDKFQTFTFLPLGRASFTIKYEIDTVGTLERHWLKPKL